MVKIWYITKKLQFIIKLLGLVIIIYFLITWYKAQRPLTHMNRNSLNAYIEERLQEALKLDKGTGCEMPKLDPFAWEMVQFDTVQGKIQCGGKDWVRCYLSECRVDQEILETHENVECTYRDIVYVNDGEYFVKPPTVVKEDNVYSLVESDHVKISCTGKHRDRFLSSRWTGCRAGMRKKIKRKPSPKERESSYNVLILGFDSTARNGFLRRMPHSYKVLTDQLRATVLNNYNIVGDGTPAALLPILTGKTELELPECRKSMPESQHVDTFPFIFYKLHDDGYRTAYFEDSPFCGTFQYRFNGFMKQPTDHYLRAFFLEASHDSRKNQYCMGDTPQFKVMLNLTEQFFKLSGKRFALTFIADISHDNFNMIAAADDDVADFLRQFQRDGHLKNTLLIVMGDHGPRYATHRNTMQGRFEERLPLMAIRLPDDLKTDRPDAQYYLNSNVDVLTTPHDIYATILDVLEMTQHWNPYKVKGADFPRSMTMLETIPSNRSCSEAGIEAHWCACVNWRPVPSTDPMYQRTAHALVEYINKLTAFVRSKCVPRSLKSIDWVTRQHVNNRMLQFKGAADSDGYVGKFDDKLKRPTETYQIKISVDPGNAVYEASVMYLTKNDTMVVDSREISRINAYNNEPACISDKHPHLNKYCYCNTHAP